MAVNSSTSANSGSEQAIFALCAAAAMFVVGYSAARVYLTNFTATASSPQVEAQVIPHQAAMWAEFGR